MIREVQGYIPVIPDAPGFVTPVLKIKDDLFIQDVDAHGTIGLIKVDDTQYLRDTQCTLDIKDGQIIFGFIVNRGIVLFNTGTALAENLKRVAVWLRHRPALLRSIERFTEDWAPRAIQPAAVLKSAAIENDIGNAEEKSSAPTSLWTEEKVELLKKLWLEGLSASQIAGMVGVTRNAVIGKVHRMKLTGRVRPGSSSPRVRVVRSERKFVLASGTLHVFPQPVAPGTYEKTAKAVSAIGAPAKAITELPDHMFGLQVVSLDALFSTTDQSARHQPSERNTCKWTISNPEMRENFYCGAYCDDGEIYCQFHSLHVYYAIWKQP